VIPGTEELRKLAEYHRSKAEDLARSVALLHQNAVDATNPVRQQSLREAADQADSYVLFTLNENLAKNFSSVADPGGKTYPTITATVDDKGRFTFSDSPNLSKAFNIHLPLIAAVARRSPTETLPNGIIVTPCLSSLTQGENLTNLLLSKGNRGLARYRGPNVGAGVINHCNNKGCMECVDCQPMQQTLSTIIRGIMPGSDDRLRTAYLKGLITLGGAMDLHQRTRGNSRKTQDSPLFFDCKADHEHMAEAFTMMQHDLRTAADRDFQESNGRGGFIHRDHFGVGNDTRRY